ncbi:MAG: CHAD domain-containing protein [Acidobacteriota bacterium]
MVTNSSEKRETTEDLAERVFSELHVTLFSFEDDARRGEVEAIHDMRVTARKLRVALANFAVCVPLERRRGIKSHLTLLADALGRVRDIDVMLESLVTIEAETPVGRKAMVADLRTRLLRRRKYHQRRLSNYFASENYRGLKEVLPEPINGQAA